MLGDGPISSAKAQKPKGGQKEEGPQPGEIPVDWPVPGPIDLSVHDLPHASSTTEWWYLNGHCVTAERRKFSVFTAFFRQLKGRDPKTKQPKYAHSLTWAIQDINGAKTHNVSYVDQSAAQEGIYRMDRGLGSKDERLNRSLREILERGPVPKPDRVFPERVFVGLNRLNLDYAGDRCVKQDDGTYRLSLLERKLALGCDLVFEPQQPITRHGDDGVVRGPNDEKMFYYFIPRCRLTGKIVFKGQDLEVSDGVGWYDHEFGFGPEESYDDKAEALLSPEKRAKLHAQRRKLRDERQVGWNWLSAHFDDGSDLTVYILRYVHTGKSAGDFAILVDKNGVRHSYDDAEFDPVEIWQSAQTFFEYPILWRLRIPSAGVDMEVKAAFADQEFITLISKPSFWEGRVELKGKLRGKTRSGTGYIERSGFAPYETLDGFFDEVSKMVRKSVEAILPLRPSFEAARNLITVKGKEHYMEGVDIQQYARTHLRPIREIVDRGGKGWRSYAAITCCDIVGGDSRNFVQWLAIPEMMHVGSLIVDDVEDQSAVRRGGPAAHKIYGEAQAINSGTAAYFIGVRLLISDLLSDSEKLRIFELYFDALRSGHAGQALDIDGFDPLVKKVVKTGKGALLESRVLAVHRLKTAAPAGSLARMGAIAGGGTQTQVEGLGRFFEDLGLAFQIIDDVLNIRGFRGNLKCKAEDLMQGKVTLPVVKALSRLDREERRWLYNALKSKNKNKRLIGSIAKRLEKCGALEDCEKQARDLVEKGWAKLEPLIEDSLSKMMLRAFGWFVLERHY